MKKQVLAILLCLVISAMMVACGNKDVTTGSADTIDTIESTESNNTIEETTESQATETEMTESTELTESTEPAVITYWDKVGIVDGIGTVYNGETVTLAGEELSAEEIAQGITTDGIYASYEFNDAGDFLQFVEADITYQDANVKIGLLNHAEGRISLSGNFELEEKGKFNDYGRDYDLIVDGNLIASFNVEGDSLDTPLEECELYGFWLYPTEGLVFNGYEFTDLQMEGVVNHFGNPNWVSFDKWGSDYQSITYLYRERISVTILASVSCGESSVVFSTQDGKNIESINISLSLTKDEIIAQREWNAKNEDKKKEDKKNEENDGKYKELESEPVDGRDGSLEHPYQVGDHIYFPKVYLAYNYEYLENIYVPLTITVEEITSDYVKVNYKYGVENWEDLDWSSWDGWENTETEIEVASYTRLFKCNGEQNEEVVPLTLDDIKGDSPYIEDPEINEVTLYYRDDFKVDKKYLMIIYRVSSLPEEEEYPYFNTTFVELP